MKIEKAVCPGCGAALKFRAGNKSVKCEYCGTVSYVSGEEAFSETPKGPGQKTAMEAGKTVSATVRRKPLFPPPGFRSKNIAHMITGAAGYLMIIYVGMSLPGLLDMLFFIIASLSVVDVCTDWTGLTAGLKGLQSDNVFVRILMKLVWSAVVFTAWIVVMVIIQMIFGLRHGTS